MRAHVYLFKFDSFSLNSHYSINKTSLQTENLILKHIKVVYFIEDFIKLSSSVF